MKSAVLPGELDVMKLTSPNEVPIMIVKGGKEKQVGIATNLKFKDNEIHFTPRFKGKYSRKDIEAEFEIEFQAIFSTLQLDNFVVTFTQRF